MASDQQNRRKPDDLVVAEPLIIELRAYQAREKIVLRLRPPIPKMVAQVVQEPTHQLLGLVARRFGCHIDVRHAMQLVAPLPEQRTVRGRHAQHFGNHRDG